MSYGYPMGQQAFPQQGHVGGPPMAMQQHMPQQQQQQHQQYMQQYQHYGQPSQHYGSYGNFYQNVFQTQAHQAYQFSSPNDLHHIFHQEMSKNQANVNRQAIQAEDLCNILNNTPSIRNYYGNSSEDKPEYQLEPRIMQRYDCNVGCQRSQDGTMQYQEYTELQQCLVSWFNVFRQHDADRSGYIEAQELHRVITGLFGYTVSPDCLSTLLRRYSRVMVGPQGDRCLIAFDDFVAVCVRIRAYTDAFRRRDRSQHGGGETVPEMRHVFIGV